MTHSFQVEIVTPDAAYPSLNIVSLAVPAARGPMTVLPGHQPCICEIQRGVVRLVDEDGVVERWNVGAGTLTVRRDSMTLLVRDAAMLPADEAQQQRRG